MPGSSCPKCAAEVVPGAVDCPHCGVVLAKARPTAARSVPPPLPRRALEAVAADPARLRARMAWMVPLGVIAALVVLVMGGLFAGKLLRARRTAAGLSASPRTAFGGRVRADLPCEPSDVPRDPGAGVRRAHCSVAGLDVNVLFVDGNGFGAYDLNRGATAMVKRTREAAQGKGSKNWHDDTKRELRQQQPAMRILESFEVGGSTYAIDALVVSDGEDAWAIQIGRVAGDDAAERLVSSALGSFAFTLD